MLREDIAKALRFYFVTDENAPGISALEQVTIALQAGATMIQYRKKVFSSGDYPEVAGIRHLCKVNRVPFVINDQILLAKAVGADGVHLGQQDDSPSMAREVLGADAVLGISAQP